MASPFLLSRCGVRLGGIDFGGNGPSALLLHGLAGHAGEWNATSEWLTEHCRVVALDARGHGSSERLPEDVSRSAHVADAAFAIEELQLGHVIVIGQSLGGQTALLLAAARPDLVRGLVVAEASPEPADEATIAEVQQALASWPDRFPTRQAAIQFFGGPSPAAEAWADGLEHRDGGLAAHFDIDVMLRTLREAATRPFWSEWEQIECPSLVVRAGHGIIPAVLGHEMIARGRHARLVEIPGAGHDLHLDSPEEWRRVVAAYLDALETSRQ